MRRLYWKRRAAREVGFVAALFSIGVFGFDYYMLPVIATGVVFAFIGYYSIE